MVYESKSPKMILFQVSEALELTLWYSNTAMDNFPFINVHPLEMIFPRASLFECFKTIYDSIDDFIIHIDKIYKMNNFILCECLITRAYPDSSCQCCRIWCL